jgi:pimeloyl-ACP methyl ester carboxylesterase
MADANAFEPNIDALADRFVEMYRGLPDGELAVVPGTCHGLLVEKPELRNAMIVEFHTTDPVPQMAPIRRA